MGRTMRIRPFFWLLLFVSCASVITLACLHQPYTPTLLQVQLEQKQLVANAPASMELNLTDIEGLPINEAQVIPSARMTNMAMIALNTHVIPQGNGKYKVNLDLYMPGPWSITIQTHAHGFTSQEKTFQVLVL